MTSTSLFKRLQPVTLFIFVLLLTAGHFKANAGMSWVPGDLTLIAAVLVIILSVLSFAALGGRLRIEALWIVFFFSGMSVALAYTDWTPYAIEKATRFFTLTFLAAIVPTLLIREVAQVKRFVVLIVSLGAFLASGVLIEVLGHQFTGSLDDRATGFTTLTLTLGNDAGLAMVAFFAYSLRGGRQRWLALLCVPLFFALLASGSRGPIFCAVAVVALLTLRSSFVTRRNLVIVALLCVISMNVALRVVEDLPRGSIVRVVTLLEGQFDASADARRTAGLTALQAIQDQPLGKGFGGFAEVYTFGGVTDHIYPHNILLDIAVDNGLPVALLFFVIVVFSLWKTSRASAINPDLLPFFSIYLFSFSVSLFSGELNLDRTLFAMITIGLQSDTLERLEPSPVLVSSRM